MQIVIAWFDVAPEVTDEVRWTSFRYEPVIKNKAVVKTAMWLRNGQEADIEKAKKHVADYNGFVFTFPASERKPFEKAKELALQSIV